MLTEIERGAEVDDAVSAWKRKFARGAASRRAVARGDTYDHPALGVSGHFGFTPRSTYWNVFSRCSYEGVEKDLIVEINPPSAATKRRPVGVVARDDKTGERWILHRGHLQAPRKYNIDAATFAEKTQLRGVSVRLRGKKETETCYRVANLSDPDRKIQRDTASFVNECVRIRLLLDRNTSEALSQMAAAFADLADGLSQNVDGQSTRPPQEEIVVNRRHDGVRDALAEQLRRKGIRHTDKRVSGLGPDLYTETILFEIKTDTSIVSIQRAIGQLHIYAAVLNRPLAKVLVMPGAAPPKLRDALRQLDVAVLTYRFGKPPGFSKLEAFLRDALSRGR